MIHAHGLFISMNIRPVDHELLIFFVSTKVAYASAWGEILGILKFVHDEMNADLTDATDAENPAVASFEELKAAKEKETAAFSKAIQSKFTHVGERGVKVAEQIHELGDLVKSKKCLGDLDVNCENKKK